jgi:hypothetical protein
MREGVVGDPRRIKLNDGCMAGAPGAPALAVAMMKTQVAWTGKYTTAEQAAEGIKLTAHVDAASSQAIFDTDRVYFIRVDGDRPNTRLCASRLRRCPRGV